MQIVERVELPEKSEILRVHLRIPSLRSDEVKAGFYADEITNERTFGNKKPPITSVKGGNTGVPTGIKRLLQYCSSQTIFHRATHTYLRISAPGRITCRNRPLVHVSPESAQQTYALTGSSFAGWFQFQPLYARILKEQPDFLD